MLRKPFVEAKNPPKLVRALVDTGIPRRPGENSLPLGCTKQVAVHQGVACGGQEVEFQGATANTPGRRYYLVLLREQSILEVKRENNQPRCKNFRC